MPLNRHQRGPFEGLGAGRASPVVRPAAPLPDDVGAALPAILARHLPGHPLEVAFPLPGGHVNRLFLVRCFGLPGPLILKVFAPERTAKLENELAAIRDLERAGAGVPTQRVAGFGLPGAGTPIPYALLTFLWGADAQGLLESGALDDAAARDLGAQLGGIVGRLHGVEATEDGFGEPRVRGPARQSWPAALFGFFEPWLKRACDRGTIDAALASRVRAMVDRLWGAVERVGPRGALVHRDLYLSNLIVRREEASGRWAVSGLIDFESARYWDPVYDLTKLAFWVFEPHPVLREPFLAAYTAVRGPLSADFDERHRLYRLVEATAGVDYFFESQPDEAAAMRRRLERALTETERP